MRSRLHYLLTRIQEELHRLRTEEDGYTTETFVVTAFLVAIGLVVLGALGMFIKSKVDAITGP
jgi:hypothetical protein